MLSLILATILIGSAVAIPIENGVEGDPEIECGPTSLTINWNTQAAFEGHVFVKGRFAEAGCINDEGGRQVAGIELPFDTCGVSRTRSLNPKGVFVSITVIITFHPKFITKVDRAYLIQCFYMEADKTVSTEIEVSMLTTEFQTQVVPMPVCRYEILSDGPTGEPVQFALVGDMVYHKWTCDTETVDTFCMRVHSCFVDDGQGDRVNLLNEDGCAIDKYLLNNLEYPADLMGGVEAHVFKYADRPQLFFQCQITVDVKDPNGDCATQTQPTCPVLALRKKRQVYVETAPSAGTLDVRTSVEALDINDQQQALPRDLAHQARPTYLHEPIRIRSASQGVCMSTAGFSAFLIVGVALLATVVMVSTCLMRRNEKL
jgi:hypothetical protein